HDRCGAHGVDVGERVGGGDAAEVARVVDDRGEEVGGGDDGLVLVELVHRGVVGGVGADQQLGRHEAGGHGSQQIGEHAGRDFAAAAAAVGEFGQSDFV